MFYTAFIFGLLGSFHCIGMCGPIAFVLPVDRNDNRKKITQIIIYHIGRLTTYTIIGLLFGLLGKGLFLSGFQQRITIIAGITMILFVMLPSRILNKLQASKPIYSFVSKVKSTLGSALKKRDYKTFLSIGLLNGLLPCGMVYMAVFGSITAQNSFNGALYMLAFGLGTLPLMTTAVYAGNFLSLKFRNNIQKAIPYIVVFIGILFILRGLGLGIPYLSPSDASLSVGNEIIECH